MFPVQVGYLGLHNHLSSVTHAHPPSLPQGEESPSPATKTQRVEVPDSPFLSHIQVQKSCPFQPQQHPLLLTSCLVIMSGPRLLATDYSCCLLAGFLYFKCNLEDLHPTHWHHAWFGFSASRRFPLSLGITITVALTEVLYKLQKD